MAGRDPSANALPSGEPSARPRHSPFTVSFPTLASWAWRHALRIQAFALVAAAGLMLDLALFTGLISTGMPAGIAALASGTAANALVYFVSVRRIFHCRSDFLVTLFGLYLCWQAASVAASAYAVEVMVAAGIVPLGAKLLILPVTFPANYVVMSALTARWNNACRNAAT